MMSGISVVKQELMTPSGGVDPEANGIPGRGADSAIPYDAGGEEALTEGILAGSDAILDLSCGALRTRELVSDIALYGSWGCSPASVSLSCSRSSVSGW